MRGLIIGLFEWDGSIDPTIIIGDSEAAIQREAVKVLMYRETPDAEPRFPFVGSDRWLTENPFPDLDDPQAVSEWLESFSDNDDVRSATEFNIWRNYTWVSER